MTSNPIPLLISPTPSLSLDSRSSTGGGSESEVKSPPEDGVEVGYETNGSDLSEEEDMEDDEDDDEEEDEEEVEEDGPPIPQPASL